MRRRIQESALETIRHKGLAQVTMGDIIKESGLSAGAIYGYYKGKDELILDVAHTVLDGRLDMLDRLATAEPVLAPAQAIAELLASIPPEWIESGVMLQLWRMSGTDPAVFEQAKGLATAMADSIDRYLTAWFGQQGMAGEDVAERSRVLLPVFMALVQGYIVQRSILPQFDPADYAASVELLVTGALAGRG